MKSDTGLYFIYLFTYLLVFFLYIITQKVTLNIITRINEVESETGQYFIYLFIYLLLFFLWMITLDEKRNEVRDGSVFYLFICLLFFLVHMIAQNVTQEATE